MEHPPKNKSLVRSWTNRLTSRRKTNDLEQGAIERTDGLSSTNQRLFSTVTSCSVGLRNRDAWTKNTEYEWYLKFINSKLHLFAPLYEFEGSQEELYEVNAIGEREVIEFLEALASAMSSSTTIPSLEDLRLKLASQALLKRVATKENALVIIFSFTGWLTMLYQPRTDLNSDDPSLSVEVQDAGGKQLGSDIYRQRSKGLRDDMNSRLPLHHLVAQFGTFVPKLSQSLMRIDPNLQVDVFQEQLVVSYLNFQTLYEVAEIQIAWVDNLSLHLDFDEKTRCLKIFRFPSFCKLVCSNMMEQSQGANPGTHRFLAPLFAELLQAPGRTNREPNRGPPMTGQDFYREVLLTYRLIFGQDKKSWKAWKRYCAAEIRRFDATTNDPLLTVLCGKSCKNETTYSDINALEIAQQYSAKVDFPFLGERLVKIQQFVLKKNPSDWKTLWNDRRDLLRFYTFWAVVIVGGASLVLGLFQSIEGALQVAYAAKQSH